MSPKFFLTEDEQRTMGRALRRSTRLVAPAEKAVEEENYLYRRYRRDEHARRERLFAGSEDGTRLRKFAATLQHFHLDTEDRMVEFVRQQNRDWLRNAPDEIRFLALTLIGERCARNRARRGLASLNDPLPGEPDDAFRLCKRELGL